MEKSRTKGVANVLKKLERSVEEGNFYEAQQMYKTIYFRHLNSKKYEEAAELLESGAIAMLNHSKFQEGTDLALLLLNVYTVSHKPVTKESLEPLLKIFAAYKGIHEENGEKIEEKECKLARESFMKAALRWSIAEGENKQGAKELHDQYALYFKDIGQYGRAQKHFLRGSQPEVFADTLAEWAKEGYQGERDLYIARAVLEYLTLANLKDANIVFERFLSKFSEREVPQTPLINFIRFLLLTLERDALPLFETLKKKYQPSIERDESFSGYLEQIAWVFFKVKPPAASGNFFADFIKNMMGGGSGNTDQTYDDMDVSVENEEVD